MADRTTPARILASALATFTELGFERTTVADLISRAGVSNGSFFHHFRSKEGVAAALFIGGIRKYQAHALAALEGGEDAAAGISAVIAAHLDWVEDHAELARFLFERGRPDWSAETEAEIAALNANVAARIDAWRSTRTQEGVLVPVSTEVLIALLIGPAQMASRNWLGGKSAKRPRGYCAELQRAALAALVIGNATS